MCVEVKLKRGKVSKKERKEKEVPSSSKAERSGHREKATASKAHAHAANQADSNPETPVTTNNRVGNKRRATQTPSAPPAEKKVKKENGVKKRTSNRLSKTPRVKAKEEDEPTYCFCSRVCSPVFVFNWCFIYFLFIFENSSHTLCCRYFFSASFSHLIVIKIRSLSYFLNFFLVVKFASYQFCLLDVV
ncbi:unnamed protein product [Cylicostephanus goldi]|uniref:Uncharacterized protein n=1 Tax=Cylicostephanus goldi TaxID=71465 RepID=A0A3P6SZA0_CYLGO|nr:unnamed protein product [Cylicostephanus goldi]